MALSDVEAVMAVVEAADAALAEASQLPAGTPPNDAELEARRGSCPLRAARRARSLGGSLGWAGGRGCPSVRPGNFWGLSMLFVHREFQSQGVAGRLLEAAGG